MNNFKLVDPKAVLAAIAPHIRDGVAVTNREGTPLMNVSCIIPTSTCQRTGGNSTRWRFGYLRPALPSRSPHTRP